MVGVRGADEYLRNGPRRDFIIKNKVQRLKRGTLAVGERDFHFYYLVAIELSRNYI